MLLSRTYVYRARTSRAGLQQQLIEALAGQFERGEEGFGEVGRGDQRRASPRG